MRVGIPAGRGRLSRKPIARQRRDYYIKSVFRLSTIGSRIGERADDLQLLNDRSGPPVRDDDRQSVGMLRTHVNEVDVEPIDRGDELRQGVQPRLHLSPVVIGRPIVRELLHGRELDALRRISDRLPLGPLGRDDPPTEVNECLFWNLDVKRSDGGVVGRLNGFGAAGCGQQSEAEGASSC